MADDKTRFMPFWQHPDGAIELVYDPWGSRDQAVVQHGSAQCRWARNIHRVILDGMVREAAVFPEWKGKTVFIVGRGKYRAAGLALREYRPGPVIFLNHAVTDCGFSSPGDLVMAFDPGVAAALPSDVPGFKLLTFPGADRELVNLEWESIRWFTFWPKAPLCDWMREEFPHLPSYTECLTVAVTALHLAAMQRPKRIVCIGMDFEDGGEDYERMGAAATAFSRFVANQGIEIINASSAGRFGLAHDGGLVPWVKRMAMKDIMELDYG